MNATSFQVETTSVVLEAIENNQTQIKQVSRTFLPNEASVSQNLDAKKSQNSMSDLDQRRLEETRNNKNKGWCLEMTANSQCSQTCMSLHA